MSQSKGILEPRLVEVDSYYLSFINDRIQNVSNDAESLALALNAINADDASKCVIVAIRSALLANSKRAGFVSETFCGYALPYQMEVIHND